MKVSLWFCLLFPVGAFADTWTLKQVQDRVLSTSEVVEQAKQSVIQSEARSSQATGSLFPSVKAVGTHFRQGPGNTSSAYNTTTGKIQATQSLFKGGAEYAGLSMTALDEKKSELDLATAKRVQLIEASRQFMNTWLAEKRVEYRKRDLELLKERVSELTQRNRIGRTRAADLQLTQSQHFSAQAKYESSTSDYQVELKRLARVSNWPTPPSAVSQHGLPSVEEIAKSMGDQDPSLNWSRERDDVLAARKQVESYEESTAISRAGHFPTAEVSGSYYFLRNGTSTSNAGVDWDLTATLSFPLFAGGTVNAQVREKAAQVRQAEIAADRIERNAALEISNLRTQILADLKSVDQLKQALAAAKKSYDLITRDERLGLASNLDVIQAMSQLESAEEEFALNEATLQSRYIEYQLSRNQSQGNL